MGSTSESSCVFSVPCMQCDFAIRTMYDARAAHGTYTASGWKSEAQWRDVACGTGIVALANGAPESDVAVDI
jgi:hypothetical protein